MADINNFYGLIRFIRAAQREGVKPVAGVIVSAGKSRLFTAYPQNRRGFARINEIVSSLLVREGPHPPPISEKNFDPVEDLLEGGWEGLTIVSDRKDTLERLMKRERRGLFVKLTFEKSFIRPLRWARGAGLPVVAVNDGVYTAERDRAIYDVLRAIDLNCTVDEVPPDQKSSTAERFAGPGEMESFFSAVPEALRNTWSIACQTDAEAILNREFVFPGFKDMTDGQAYCALRALCKRGVERRYGSLTPGIERRLNYELNIIRQKRFSSYFLVVHDIVSRFPRTCGRGSAAASVVSYILGITHVDPIKYDLYFERFLNHGRNDPPDIDVDFPWDERSRVLEYVFRRYQGRSGMVANHVTLGPRACIRETAGALGLSEEETGRLIRCREIGKEGEIPDYIMQVANRIRGFPHYLGTHCGGVVITPESLSRYTHFQFSPQGYPVIAWEKDAVEEAGLVKIDLLGNRSLAVLRDALKIVKSRHGRCLEWASFCPLKDRGTRNMIEEGKTVGIFYIESPATRQLLIKMRNGDFEHLITASSIIRPAANAYIREYVDRLHGKNYRRLHPRFEETLKETYGIMVYQEDVSRVAIAVSGFSPTEADRLRKVLSKKRGRIRLPDFRERFFQGGEGRGVPGKDLEEIWEAILSFQGYSFCKAHSASYALVSYKLAYLKLRFPLEFMVSVINNGGGYYSCQTYLDECRRMGFELMGPDINRSQLGCVPEGNAVRIGFRLLRELQSNFMKRVIREKEGEGEYKGIDDLVRRLSPGLPEMRVLICSGALDTVAEGLTRPQLFWMYFNVHRFEGLFLPPIPRCVGDYTPARKLLDEVKTMGLIISCHPLDVFRDRIRKALRGMSYSPLISSKELSRYVNCRVTLTGLLVTGKEVRTRSDEKMIFVSFEDFYSIFETVFFPKAFRRYYTFLDQAGVYIILGLVVNEQGALSVNVEKLVRVSREPADNEISSFNVRSR
jgi:error-prone DNA polymerase